MATGDSFMSLDGQVTIENNSDAAAFWSDSRGGGNGRDEGARLGANGLPLQSASPIFSRNAGQRGSSWRLARRGETFV